MTIDRTHWGPGPWDGEPDELEWVTLVGYLGYLNRGSLHGALNGYVAVPRGHPLFGRDYHDLPLRVHDGVTFSEPSPPGRELEEALWWFGFSGGNSAFDFAPAIRAHFRQRGREYPDPLDRVARYRTVEFMRAQAESLASQLHAIARGVPS